MSLILPSAPANFYAPSLNELKDKLEAVNGSTKGQLTLITGIPTNIENCWSEVGAGGDTLDGSNRGSLVVANVDIPVITGPILGPEESLGENGYKLVFDAIDALPVYIDGTGSSSVTIIGGALVEGADLYAAGTAGMVRYLLKTSEITVTDGGLITLPSFEIVINYSEPLQLEVTP